MHVIDLQGNEYALQATSTSEFELNGNQSLSLTILPAKANLAFISNIAEMWTVVDDNDVAHKVVYAKRQGVGNRLNVDIKAVPLFFDVFDNQRIYEEYNRHMTAQAAFSLIFADSGYNFVLHDSHDALDWEGFGGGESRLETFKRAINRYGAEFEISGNTIHLKALIGRDTQFMYRHRLNASNIAQEIDASGFWTYAKGYGDFGESGEDDGGGGDWQDAKLIREYTSPLASVLGIRHAPPIKDGRVKIASAMDRSLKAHVDESLKVSVSTDIHDLRRQGYALAQPQLGDRVFLIDERIGFDEEVRVVAMSVTKDWRGDVTHFSITIGDEGVTKRHISNLNTAVNNITNIVNGTQKIPYSVLDNAVLQATKALQNAQTELTFGTNGILAIDKLDPNNVTILNSAGVGVSTDGGATFGEAITGRGINASYIVTGVLDAGQVVVRGGSATDYTLIDGSHITMRGQFSRTWRGSTDILDVTTQMRNGYIRFSNPAKQRALNISDYGISTFLNGTGGADGDASGVIEFFSRRFSDQFNPLNHGLTFYSGQVVGVDAGKFYVRSESAVDLTSNSSGIRIHPYSGETQRHFWFTKSTDFRDGYLVYGNENREGLRFRGSTVQVVDSDYSTGGITTIEAGIGLFNDIYKRTSNTTVYWNGTSGGSTSINVSDNTLRASGIRANTGSSDIFLATNDGAVRVTDGRGNNEGNGISYKPLACERVSELGSGITSFGAMSLLADRPQENEATSIINNTDLLRATENGVPIYEVVGDTAISHDEEGQTAKDIGRAIMIALKALQEQSSRLDKLEKGVS